MGFKRMVSLACDGPCGTVLAETEKAPVGWAKVHVTAYERLANGDKPKVPARSTWLCAACLVKLERLMTVNGFTLNVAPKHEEASQ